MYNVELVEAKKLIDETAKEAGDADRRKQQNAAEYERMQGLFRRASGPRKSNIDEIEELQRQIAENDAVRDLVSQSTFDRCPFFFCRKLPSCVVVSLISKMNSESTKAKIND